jgi:hypothetical protein
MTRWLMLALMIVGFALAIVTKSPAVLGVGLLLGLVGLIGFVFSLAADRVSASARPESAMLDSEDLAAMRTRRVGARPAAPPSTPVASKPSDASKSTPR